MQWGVVVVDRRMSYQPAGPVGEDTPALPPLLYHAAPGRQPYPLPQLLPCIDHREGSPVLLCNYTHEGQRVSRGHTVVTAAIVPWTPWGGRSASHMWRVQPPQTHACSGLHPANTQATHANAQDRNTSHGLR